jgi:hypothetical protein
VADGEQPAEATLRAPQTKDGTILVVGRSPPLQGTPSAGISRVPYLPGLDGLRGIAVVAVMLYHAHHSWLPGGYLGVEVFFVISGYLITLLLIGEYERSKTIDLRQFWARRFRRLLPALYLVLLIVAVRGRVLPDVARRAGATSSAASSTSATGTRSSSARATAAVRRSCPCATCGRWRSRSSSTSSGRC